MSDMDSMVVACDFDEKLILEVEKHMCLYDPNRSDYKDQVKKAHAWKMVAAVVGWDGRFKFISQYLVVAIDCLYAYYHVFP